MTWEFEERQRRMRNYSIMLKAALIFLVFALALTMAGGVRIVVKGDPFWLAYGLLFLVWSSGSAYLTIDSTVRLFDGDTKVSGARSEY